MSARVADADATPDHPEAVRLQLEERALLRTQLSRKSLATAVLWRDESNSPSFSSAHPSAFFPGSMSNSTAASDLAGQSPAPRFAIWS